MQRYLVLFCVTVIMIYESGIIKSYSTLLPTLREQLISKTWMIGLAISLIRTIGCLACLLLLRIEKSGWFGSGNIIIFIGSLTSVGLILCSVCKNTPEFFVTIIMQSFIPVAKVSALGILPKYFDVDDIDTANTIAAAGVSLGVIIMPPLTQFVLDLYGWRGTLEILGALMFHCVACGVWIRYCENSKKKSKQLDYHSLDIEKPHNQSEKEYKDSQGGFLNVKLLKNTRFLNILVFSSALSYSYTSWLIYLIPHAEDRGIEPSAASLLGTIGGFGNLFGKLAFIICRKWISLPLLLYVSCFICAVSAAIDPLMKTYSLLAIASNTFAFAVGLAFVTGFTSIHKTVEPDMIVDAIAWFYAVSGVSAILAGYTMGLIYDYTGSYDASFVIMGLIMLLPIMSFGIERLLQFTILCDERLI